MESLFKNPPFLTDDFSILGLVLLLPMLGAFVNGVFGKRLGKDAVRLMALSALGGAFIASVITFLKLLTLSGGHGEEAAHAVGKVSWTAWTWMVAPFRGDMLPLRVKFSVDLMSGTMMLVVTGVGFLIHLYSSEYMKKDPGYYRFFSYLNLFCFSMLVLIMGDSLPILFVGWEGVGLCSYLLIGFWFKEEKNATAGKKAFIANRVGDFGLLLAMAMLLHYTGSLEWDGIKSGAGGLTREVTIWPIGNLDSVGPSIANWPGWIKSALTWLLSEHKVYASTLVGLALFLGCAGKSAQIPLYVWLPDAMAGPTPVSALIHAATMVTAGVYLVARLSFVFIMSPAAMATVAFVGALTAIFAATMGLFQRDLKKVLAYSTVSQLGFMFIGVGTGAFVAGFFHVFTHAFFKACLFLGAGSVIHAMHARIHDTDASQDMYNMGGLRKYMPITHLTFLVSCLSIAGAPLLAGFWSKDEILWKAYSTEIHHGVVNPKALQYWMPPAWFGQGLYWIGIIAASMTAFYMFRAYFMTFWGEFRGWKIQPGWKDPHAGKHHHHDHEDDKKPKVGPVPHESPYAMTVPLMVLGVMAVVAGFLGAEAFHFAPLTSKLEHLFSAAETRIHLRAGVEAHGSQMWLMMLPGFLAFVGGSGLAYMIYVAGKGAWERGFAGSFLHRLLFNKWYVDEFYEYTVLGMVDALADIFVMADVWIVDGILAKLSALVVKATGSVLRLFQTGRVQVYAAAMVLGMVGVGWYVSTPHAAYTVDATNLSRSGQAVVHATTGLGYSYKWSGDNIPEKDFSATQELALTVEEGKSRTVVLTVKNALGRESKETIVVSRPSRRSPSPMPGMMGGAQ